MINFLGLKNLIDVNSSKYGNKTGKTMTATIINYLSTKYPEKAD